MSVLLLVMLDGRLNTADCVIDMVVRSEYVGLSRIGAFFCRSLVEVSCRLSYTRTRVTRTVEPRTHLSPRGTAEDHYAAQIALCPASHITTLSQIAEPIASIPRALLLH